MIEVKDEILSDVPKFRIRDDLGNIIFDNITIEMITQIIQQGTPLNKVLFDSIQTYLLEIIDKTNQAIIPNISRTSTYNLLTVSDYPLDCSLQNRTLKMRIPFKYESSLTQNILPTFSINSGYSVEGTFSNVQNIFDDSTTTCATAKGEDASDENFLIYRMPKTKITSISVTVKYLKNAVLYGSLDDGITWEKINDLTSSSSSTTKTYSISSKEYNALKIITKRYSTSNNTAYIYKITITGYKQIYNPLLPTYIKFSDSSNILLDEKPLETGRDYLLIYNSNKYQSVKTTNSGLLSNILSVKTGIITNGGVIPKTDGYKHYIYFVSPYSAGADSAEDNSYEADGNGWLLTCSVNQVTREVIAEAVSKTRRDTSNTYTGITTESATANYLEIAWN